MNVSSSGAAYCRPDAISAEQADGEGLQVEQQMPLANSSDLTSRQRGEKRETVSSKDRNEKGLRSANEQCIAVEYQPRS